MGVMSDHNARAFGAAARAFRRSAGTLGSGSSPDGAISSVTTSPASAPAASRIFRFTLSQWLLWPSGSSVARKGKPLMVPSAVVMPREGSFALASFGRVRKVQEPTFAVAAGWSDWLDVDLLLLRQIHVVHDHDKPLATRSCHDEIH